MLAGEAAEWSHTYDEKIQWTNAKIWKFWNVVPVAVELAIRRIKWWQSVAKHPEANQQLLTAIFSVISDEDTPSISHDGLFSIVEGVNFAARRIWEDLSLLLSSEECREFCLAWNPRRVDTLFGTGENHAKDAFLAIDPCFLRAAFHSESWAPPESVFGTSIPNPEDMEPAADEEHAQIYICDINTGKGQCLSLIHI